MEGKEEDQGQACKIEVWGYLEKNPIRRWFLPKLEKCPHSLFQGRPIFSVVTVVIWKKIPKRDETGDWVFLMICFKADLFSVRSYRKKYQFKVEFLHLFSCGPYILSILVHCKLDSVRAWKIPHVYSSSPSESNLLTFIYSIFAPSQPWLAIQRFMFFSGQQEVSLFYKNYCTNSAQSLYR